MAAVAYLVANPDVPHGTVKVAFNPDEEVGRGVVHFPVETFGAVAAYTVDGSTVGEVQQDTFSGAQVRMKIRGGATSTPRLGEGRARLRHRARRGGRRAAAEGLSACWRRRRGREGLRPS